MSKQLLLIVIALTTSLLFACGESTPPPANTDAAATLSLPEQPPSARLPSSISPTHYRLQLTIDPREARFSGITEIDVTLDGNTPFVWLHGRELDVSSATAVLASGEVINLTWQQASAHGVAKLTAQEPLPAGKLQLLINYSAPFDTNLQGLHTVEQGGISYAFTQFEATSARLAFPSFDEPGFKVPFDIRLTVPADYSAISNTPVVDEVAAANGLKTLTFATTKPLPTYLIAFAVGPFDIVEWEPIPANAVRPTPLPLRGVTTRGKGSEIHFALENTAAIVHEMEKFFDTPYPYAKLDIIAVPDFSAGAMENAGAITYREQLILLDENASVGQKRGFFSTHAHEIAHQWFGNLVTPVWWDDIWLNESFATWNAAIIMDKLFPDQKYRDALQNSVSRVMRNDSLASARQIRESITRHEDISSAFNGITYQKGGGVLSMFEAFLGRDNFRDGIRHYMKVHAFGNTTAEDFIGAIADANPQVNGADLREAFASYIEQPGLPIISTALTCSEDGVSLEVSQQRYLPIGSEGSRDQTWVIPACVSMLEGDKSSDQCFLLKNQSETIVLNTERCPDALLPNTGGTSYYRWSQSAEQWAALLAHFQQLSVTEQISIASSLSAAVNAGKIELDDYLAAVPTIIGSESWRVAIAPRADLYKIKEFVASDAERTELEAMLVQWYQPVLDELNAAPTLSPDQEQFRMFMMSTLALGAHDPAIRAELAAMGAAYTGFGTDQSLHHDAVDPNLVYIALLVAADEYGKPFTDLLWQQFKASDNAHDRQELLAAMAYSIEPSIAAAVRDRILSSDLRDNEIFIILYGQMGRSENRQAMWDWTKTNMTALLDRIPNWNKGKLPANFATFCSPEQADDMERAFGPIIDTLEAGPRYLANAVETIRLCAAFVEHHQTPKGE